jgi:replicative DNA helicase
MEGEKLAQRWDAYAAGISYSAMKRGQLTPADYDKWMRVAEKAAEAKFEKDIIVIDNERRPTADFIYGQIEKWRPSFSVVDTLDEVRAPAHLRSVWEQQDFVARELKGIARSSRRPLIGIAQAGRDAAEEGATLGNIAGSITIARKADIVIGLHATPEMKKSHMTEFRLLKNRDDPGEGSKFTLYWNVGTGEMRPWTPQDNVATKPQG